MSRWAASAERLRDAAVLIPFAAAVLFLPPFILLFAAPVSVFGIPLIVLHVFGVWAGLVVCAWIVARRLRPPGATGVPAPETGPETARQDAD